MNALQLRTMSDVEFETFRKMGCEQYARTSPIYSGMPADEALKLVLHDFDSRMAPQKLQTEGQHFLAIVLNEEQIGFLHFGEFPRGSKSIYAWNFHVFESFQRKGHAKSAMEAAQIYLKDLGYTKVALNVMSANPVAIRLYEKFGFKISQVSMERKLL